MTTETPSRPICLLTEEEIVASLKNATNLIASKRVVLEAAHSLDTHNKTLQEINLTTQVENYKQSVIEYEQTTEKIIMLGHFTKTIDQSVILNHQQKSDGNPNIASSSHVSKVTMDDKQIEGIINSFNDTINEGKEASVRVNIENKMKVSELIPRLRKLFVKRDKDEENIQIFTEAQKYLDKMEFMRNITSCLLADCSYEEVMKDPKLREIRQRIMVHKSLADYYITNDPTMVTSNNDAGQTVNSRVDTTNMSMNTLRLPQYHSDPPLMSESMDYEDNNVGDDVRDENGVSNERCGVANTTVQSKRKQGDHSFRSEILNATRTTRNEVSGIARLNLNDTASEANVNEPIEEEEGEDLEYVDDEELSGEEDGTFGEESEQEYQESIEEEDDDINDEENIDQSAEDAESGEENEEYRESLQEKERQMYKEQREDVAEYEEEGYEEEQNEYIEQNDQLNNSYESGMTSVSQVPENTGPWPNQPMEFFSQPVRFFPQPTGFPGAAGYFPMRVDPSFPYRNSVQAPPLYAYENQENFAEELYEGELEEGEEYYEELEERERGGTERRALRQTQAALKAKKTQERIVRTRQRRKRVDRKKR